MGDIADEVADEELEMEYVKMEMRRLCKKNNCALPRWEVNSGVGSTYHCSTCGAVHDGPH